MSASTGSVTMAKGGQPSIAELSRRFGLTRTVAGWLLARGALTEHELAGFLEPKLADLTQPDAMVGRQAATRRIAAAIRARQRIVVFGDYDCDGITSTAILTEVVRALGGQVVPLLASRFEGGYGLSGPAAERVCAAKPALLVTCDCGSSDHRSLSLMRERGIDVVVIDHHLVPDEPLPALAFLNPHRPECGFPYKGLASCGLALSIAAALRKELGVKLDVRSWLDLVAIGTIADVAPLDGDNRVLVSAGLKVLAGTARPGLRALFQLGKLDVNKPLTGRDVAFRIAPLINGPGRLGAPDPALSLLLERDVHKAEGLASSVWQISEQRRALQHQMADQAIAEIESEGYDREPAIVLGREGWSHGIVGIVAGRLADRYARPVVVIGFEDGVGRGSVRGPKGLSLHAALAAVQDCLVRFGGHHAAAGLELQIEKLATFRERFSAAVKQARVSMNEAAEQAPLELYQGDRLPEVAADLARLEPCGEANPRPAFRIGGQVTVARAVKGGHLKLELALDDGQRIGGFGIQMGERAAQLPPSVEMIGDLRVNDFPGGPEVEVFIERLLP